MAELTPRLCLPPTPPVMACSITRLYGAPIGRAGRDNVPILAVAVHCIKDDYNGFLSKACTGSTKLMPVGHASFHYVLDADSAQLTSLVDEANLAWAFQSYTSNFPVTQPVQPPPCPDDCPPPVCPPPPVVIITPEEAYPGWPQFWAIPYSADFYTINIGITSPSRPEDSALDGGNSGCCGPYGLTDAAYAKLVRLIAWIADRYDIPALNIAFHDDIVPTILGCEECRCDADGACLKCDVSAYCEPCDAPGDPTYAREGDIFWIYGENQSGCKVRVKVTDLAAILAEL